MTGVRGPSAVSVRVVRGPFRPFAAARARRPRALRADSRRRARDEARRGRCAEAHRGAPQRLQDARARRSRKALENRRVRVPASDASATRRAAPSFVSKGSRRKERHAPDDANVGDPRASTLLTTPTLGDPRASTLPTTPTLGDPRASTLLTTPTLGDSRASTLLATPTLGDPRASTLRADSKVRVVAPSPPRKTGCQFTTVISCPGPVMASERQ